MPSCDFTTLSDLKSHLGIAPAVSTYDEFLSDLIPRVSDAIETYCNRYFCVQSYTLERYDGDGTHEVYVRNYPIISVERLAVGTVGAMQVRGTSADAFSATASITRTEGTNPANTHIKLSTHGGANDGDVSIAFSGFATITLLAAEITAQAGWTASAIGGYGGWASTELVQMPSRECLSSYIAMEVPDTRLCEYDVHYKTGSISALSSFSLRPVFGSGWNNIWVDYTGGYTTIPGDLEQICIDICADIYKSRGVNTAMISEKIGDYSYKLASPSEVRTAIYRHKEDLDMWRRIEFG